ncbi:MAG: RNA-binding protein [Luteolibacter sp.]
MSDDTQNSRNSGDSRRRRSRGGQNRNNNNNSERRGSNGRQSGGGRRDGGKREGGRKQGSGSGKPQRRPMPKPIELTWWQKLLKTVGLYKEPVRPPRPERRPDANEPKKTREPREPRRTKTRERDARSEGSKDESGEEPRRGKQRRERGERDKNRPRGGDPSTVENRRVYVGNLSYDTTESDLEELFKGVGAVRRVEIVYNRSTHRSKGYGFIEMIDVDEAKRTVEVLHDQFFMGRQLTVSGAKSKDHEDAEKEEPINAAQNNTMPPLAPINPNKEEVLDLIDETPKEEILTEVVTEEPHAEIPTEEFSPEADAPEEVKNEANA